ncbi:VC0807 family protein [Streptomyces sp. NPDC013455]|uniref:VC0807 family protein n=1 Tax=Streptomyces sp. NPDC013455 TaxID=3155605 RepID=UPI0033E0A0DA
MADTTGHGPGGGTRWNTAEPSEPTGSPERAASAGPAEPAPSPESARPPRPHGPLGPPEPVEPRRPARSAGPAGTVRGALLSLAVDLLLPLVVYYAARALGAGQAPALLLSGAPPALRLLAGAVRYRRIDGLDLFFTALLATAALVSVIGGGPRVLLFKNAVLPLAVGGWALGTVFTSRPLAYQLGQRLHTASAARARDRLWQRSAPFRHGLRVLTLVWGAEQFLDGALGSLAAATLPTDTVPLLDRAVSFTLLGLTAVITAGYARRFRLRHALPLFGAPAPVSAPGGTPGPPASATAGPAPEPTAPGGTADSGPRPPRRAPYGGVG